MSSSDFYRPLPDCQIRGIDALYTAAFGSPSRGVFVEVGAFDGKTVSNTCFLADAGWRGIYIEPIPQYAALCRARHLRSRDVTIVNKAIGIRQGVTELHVAGVLSTGNESFFAAYQKISWARPLLSAQKIEVPMTTLENVLHDSKVEANFELLVVDVEGAEADVFASFDLAYWRPRMVIVEMEDMHPDFRENVMICEAVARLRQQIELTGYTAVYRDHINTVFRAM